MGYSRHLDTYIPLLFLDYKQDQGDAEPQRACLLAALHQPSQTNATPTTPQSIAMFNILVDQDQPPTLVSTYGAYGFSGNHGKQSLTGSSSMTPVHAARAFPDKLWRRVMTLPSCVELMLIWSTQNLA